MKKLPVIFLISFYFMACTSSPSTDTAAASKDSVTAAPAVALPYTAVYSSDFVAGKPADVLTVLNSYKAWQDNDMVALRATFGDANDTLIFANGMMIAASGDSLVAGAKKYRDSLSKVELTFYAWTSNHSVDRNEEWVNVWYKEVDNHKTGKVDSAFYEDDNRLKDGKIVWASSHEQKYLKKK